MFFEIKYNSKKYNRKQLIKHLLKTCFANNQLFNDIFFSTKSRYFIHNQNNNTHKNLITKKKKILETRKRWDQSLVNCEQCLLTKPNLFNDILKNIFQQISSLSWLLCENNFNNKCQSYCIINLSNELFTNYCCQTFIVWVEII